MSEKIPEKGTSTSTHDDSAPTHPTTLDQNEQKNSETPDITSEKLVGSVSASGAASTTTEASPAAPSVTPVPQQSWGARAKAALKDRSTQTLIIASLALGLSLIALMIALCDSRHDHRDSHRDRYHHSEMMEQGVGGHRHSDTPRGDREMMYDMRDVHGAFEDMWQRHQASLDSIDSALSREMVSGGRDTVSYEITRSLLSEIDGQVSGTLSFVSGPMRDQAADRLKKAGIKIEKIGAQDLRLESDKGLGFVQRVLQSR